MLAVPTTRAAILGQKAWPYLLLARFAEDKSAPLGTPLGVDIGTLTINDTTNKLTQAGGRLVSSGINAGGDPRAVSAASFARQAGRAFLFDIQWTTNRGGAGWSGTSNPTGTPNMGGVGDNAGQLVAIYNGEATTESQFSTGVPYSIAAVLRSSGSFVLAKGGVYTQWTLLRVGSAGASTPLWACPVIARITDCALSVDNARVLDLSAPWNSDYGIATSRNAGAVARGTTFDCGPDAVVEHILTTLPPTTIADLALRDQDAGNRWIVRVAADGSMGLLERIAAVSTSRASSVAGTVTAGNRIVTIMDGSTIKVYVSDVLKMTYSSASSLATQRGGSVSSSNEASSVISDVVAWPRTIALPQGV